MSKRRAKGGVGVQPTTNAVLVVRHRPLNDQETAAQDMRRTQLEPLEPEEAESEADEAEVGDVTENVVEWVGELFYGDI